MANEIRERVNFVGGITIDDPLLATATTLNSYALARIPVIDSTNHAVVILDDIGEYGDPEIVYVIEHAADTTYATILRGQEGSVAREHPVNTSWTHGPAVSDFSLSKLEDVSGTPNDGDTLVHNSTTGLWEPGAGLPTYDTSWRYVGTSGNPGFLNGWVNYSPGVSSGFTDCAFRKDVSGTVHLSGLVRNGSSNVIFTLPSGYRPSEQALFATISNGAIGRVDIYTSGNVQANSPYSNVWLALDGISFLANGS